MTPHNRQYRARLVEQKRSLQNKLANLRTQKSKHIKNLRESIARASDRNYKTKLRNRRTSDAASYDRKIQSLRQEIESYTNRIKSVK